MVAFHFLMSGDICLPITVHNYVAPLFCSYLEILLIFLSQHSSFCKIHHFTLLMDQMFGIVLETFVTMHNYVYKLCDKPESCLNVGFVFVCRRCIMLCCF